MKKLLFVVFALFALSVRADNTITSKEYVDGQVATLQTQIPAKNTNTVVTNTGTAGTVGEKAIYDTTAAYGAQTDALVTAGAFNSAVQNALESEFVCTEWLGDVHDNAHCLLYEVRGATANQTLPSGYTQLEYLESTGTQWIPTGILYRIQDTGMVEIDIRFTTLIGKYFGTNAYLQLTAKADGDNAFLTIGYGERGQHVSAYARNNITELWDGPSLTTELYVGNDLIGRTTWTNTYNAQQYTIFALAPSGAQTSKGILYNLKLTKNGILVRDFIPARRDSDSKLGMYDLVSSTFFTNSGTDEFIAGPVVSSNLYLPSGN